VAGKKIIISVGIFVLVVVGFFMMSGGSTGNVVSAKGLVKIPLPEISGQAKFYEHEGIKYFVVQASDTQGGHENPKEGRVPLRGLQAGGSVKTAFDACDVCYKSGKGYRQQGSDMICNNCGNYYPISGLGTENLAGGGCWSGYLPSKVEGEYLVIKETDLNKGAYRF